MPDRLQLAVPCILEQTLGLRFFEQYQSFFVDSILADGDPQMSSSIRVNDFVAAKLTISSAHLGALVFLSVSCRLYEALLSIDTVINVVEAL